MKKHLVQPLIFRFILILTLFSYWAGFALLVINPYFFQDLPGYKIGRICIWELIAMGLSIIISYVMVKRWGNLTIVETNHHRKLVLHANYGTYFAVYFLIAIVVAIWQFWLFSLKF